MITRRQEQFENAVAWAIITGLVVFLIFRGLSAKGQDAAPVATQQPPPRVAAQAEGGAR